MHIRIGCICVIFFQSEFSNVSSSVSSNCLPQQMQNHIGCFYVAYPYIFFLTNCRMFHKKKRSCWWQISTGLIPPKFANFFLMNKTFTFSKSICVEGMTKNATQSKTTSLKFLQPLMFCFRQYMGGWNTVAQILFCGFLLPKGYPPLSWRKSFLAKKNWRNGTVRILECLVKCTSLFLDYQF